MITIEGASYPVLIGAGLIDRLGELLPPRRSFLVTDENVAAAGWAARAAAGLDPIGTCLIPAGEEAKDFRHLEMLVDALLDAGIERSDRIVAVGGGAVTDIAGFAAAIVKRGCGFVPVPTTLLGQADAAIGGKTAIDTRHGKNLVGAFHAPEAVIVDVATLATLPKRELRAGYSEVVKYGLIGDPGFFGWCEANAGALLAGDSEARLFAVETAVRAKLALVDGDERDTRGRRALLNFGHSFGHAIEAETGLPHGEAVAIGMALAVRFCAARGLCPPVDAAAVERHLAALGLPTRLAVDSKAMLARMAHDKKRVAGRLRLVLTRGIGRAFLDEVDPADLATFLASESARIAVG